VIRAHAVVAALTLIAAGVGQGAAWAQERPEAPPPGGIVEHAHDFAVALGAGHFRWDDAAPYDDLSLFDVSVERLLWQGIRGRAGAAFGRTDLNLEGDKISTNVFWIDLQVLVAPEFGPLADSPVLPYGLIGVGAVVTDPSEDPRIEPTTRSQSSVTWGGGVRGRVARRLEASADVVGSMLRLADPVNAQDNDTTTIHNLRWEGRIQWRF